MNNKKDFEPHVNKDDSVYNREQQYSFRFGIFDNKKSNDIHFSSKLEEETFHDNLSRKELLKKQFKEKAKNNNKLKNVDFDFGN
jgi:hypothetical protein